MGLKLGQRSDNQLQLVPLVFFLFVLSGRPQAGNGNPPRTHQAQANRLPGQVAFSQILVPNGQLFGLGI